VNAPREMFVDANGRRCRVWEHGEGRPVFWLASPQLLYRWSAIHAALSGSVRLVVCSLPGYPGNERNHDDIDDHLDWCLAAHDLLGAAGFKRGDILMGSSTAGALAADVAAIWPQDVERLILIAPHGLFDAAEPSRDMFALHPRDAAAILSTKPDVYKAQIAPPANLPPVLWSIDMVRANEASARFLWPLSDTRVGRRLSRITAHTCIVWGADDRIMPPSYAQRFAGQIARSEIIRIADAGHFPEIDAPDAVAGALLRFAQVPSTGANAEVARYR
jgi:pimeloyl-ACP methyl ester carboxylesterase